MRPGPHPVLLVLFVVVAWAALGVCVLAWNTVVPTWWFVCGLVALVGSLVAILIVGVRGRPAGRRVVETRRSKIAIWATVGVVVALMAAGSVIPGVGGTVLLMAGVALLATGLFVRIWVGWEPDTRSDDDG